MACTWRRTRCDRAHTSHISYSDTHCTSSPLRRRGTRISSTPYRKQHRMHTSHISHSYHQIKCSSNRPSMNICPHSRGNHRSILCRVSFPHSLCSTYSLFTTSAPSLMTTNTDLCITHTHPNKTNTIHWFCLMSCTRDQKSHIYPITDCSRNPHSIPHIDQVSVPCNLHLWSE